MEIYLVGGAVRDELLGRTVQERDWVVVGSSVQSMLAEGYRQVGRDFPVFLHPDTGEEYALARTERKTGPGHTGFEVHADESVTLEEDLERRDLTINAMARATDGSLVDPYGGQNDLRARLLRHVSDAFEEDPLRVFRVARFAAQLPDFEVAEETRTLIRRMAAAGALDELSAERVWGELVKALKGPSPDRFVDVLRDCQALSPWFEEFELLDPVPGSELDTVPQRFAAFVSRLSLVDLDTLASRLKTPRHHHRLARWIIQHGALMASWRSAELGSVYNALRECRAFKPDSELAELLAVVEVLHGCTLDDLIEVVARITVDVQALDLQARGLDGAQLGAALDQARIEALAAARQGAPD